MNKESYIKSKELIDVLMKNWKPDMKFQELLDLIQTIHKADVYDHTVCKDEMPKDLLFIIPKTSGYVVHEDHLDKVYLENIDLGKCEPVYSFVGECADDGLPFAIDVTEKEIETTILSEKEAEKKVWS